MRSVFNRKTRRSVAVAALFAYAVPLALALTAGTLHAAVHVAEFLMAERDRLVAMGMLHDSGPSERETRPNRGFQFEEELYEGFVHQHGGVIHAHGGLLSGSLDGEWAEGTDQGEGGDEAAAILHVPVWKEVACELPPSGQDELKTAVHSLEGMIPTPPTDPPKV